MKTLMVLVAVLWAGVGWAAGHTVVEVKPCPETWVKESGPGACRYEIGYSQWHTVEVDGMPVDCRDRLEAAMRAMERYRERDDAWVTIGDATNTITWFTPDPMPMCCDYPLQIDPPPPPPTLEEKIEALEQETTRKIRAMKKAAAEAEEARGRRIVNDAHRKWAYQEWEAVKASCWRNP